MFRFTLGVAVGIIVGRPVMAMMGRRILPVMVEKTLVGVSKAANHVADRLDRYSDKESKS